MADSVSSILEHLPKAGTPPLHLWHPDLSGDIDIVIRKDGSWWHEGGEIKRQALVSLFASILRYEPDTGYVLVTPVEKWRIQVEDVPFICIASDQRGSDYYFALNTGSELKLGLDHPLRLKPYGDTLVPYVFVRDGLEARVNTVVYYRLASEAVEYDQQFGLWSDNTFFKLT